MNNHRFLSIPNLIDGFPYAERNCPYCEQPLELVNACHIVAEPEHYKAVMICYNDRCDYYDGPCREAYVRVYYSSVLAADKLTGMLLKFNRPAKGPVAFDEIKDPEEGLDVFFKEEEGI